MPYIKQDRRNRLIEFEQLDYESIDSAGELNFAITKICKFYMEKHGGLSYANINEIIGALECSKLEFYRRIAFYEDQKIQENGDVY